MADARICALEGCDESLEGMTAGAIYHSRRCKLVAHKRRQRAAERAAARDAERVEPDAPPTTPEPAKMAHGVPPHPSQRPDNPTYSGDQIWTVLLELNRDDRRQALAEQRGLERAYRRRHPLPPGTVI